jgi:opacity protein-like surface antigen
MSKMIKIAAATGALAVAVGLAGSAVAADLILDPVEAPVVVSADPGDWYVSLFGGGTFTQGVVTDYYGAQYTVNFDPGYVLGIAIGTEIFNDFRAELELSHSRVEASEYEDSAGAGFDPAEGPMTTTYLLANLWYDFDTGSGFTPYVGVGAGIGHADTGFAAQVGAGVAIEVTDNVAIDVGYRLKGIFGLDFEDSDGGGVYTGANVVSHNVQAGLRFTF